MTITEEEWPDKVGNMEEQDESFEDFEDAEDFEEVHLPKTKMMMLSVDSLNTITGWSQHLTVEFATKTFFAGLGLGVLVGILLSIVVAGISLLALYLMS